jgi:hypothetical protein
MSPLFVISQLQCRPGESLPASVVYNSNNALRSASYNWDEYPLAASMDLTLDVNKGGRERLFKFE